MREWLLAGAIVVTLAFLNDVEDYAKYLAVEYGYAYLWRDR